MRDHWPYLRGTDTHAIKLLLVVRAGLGAVVGHKHKLFAWAHSMSCLRVCPILDTKSYLCSAAYQLSPLCQGICARQTRVRLSFSYRQPAVPSFDPLADRGMFVQSRRYRVKRTIAVKQENLLQVSIPTIILGICQCRLTSNWSTNASMPALSPVRYLGAILV